jgi:hypothetical protein
VSNLPLPGRIYFRANGEANSYSLIDHNLIKWVMALLVNGEHTTARQGEIMERMAACWNACAGIPTEELEIIADADETFTTVHNRCIDQRDELLAALLAALKYAKPVMEREKKSPSNAQWMVEAVMQEETFINAAIAKVKGGAA